MFQFVLAVKLDVSKYCNVFSKCSFFQIYEHFDPSNIEFFRSFTDAVFCVPSNPSEAVLFGHWEKSGKSQCVLVSNVSMFFSVDCASRIIENC